MEPDLNMEVEPDDSRHEVKEKCCFCSYVGNKAELCNHVANYCEILEYENEIRAFSGSDALGETISLDKYEDTAEDALCLKEHAEGEIESVGEENIEIENGLIVEVKDVAPNEQCAKDVTFGDNATMSVPLDLEPKLHHDEMRSTEVKEAPKVEIEPDEVNHEGKKIMVEEDDQPLDAQAKIAELSLAVDVEYMDEHNDTAEKEDFKRFSQWTGSMWLRLNIVQKKMAHLIGSRARDFNAKIVKVIQNLIEKETDINVEMIPKVSEVEQKPHQEEAKFIDTKNSKVIEHEDVLLLDVELIDSYKTKDKTESTDVVADEENKREELETRASPKLERVLDPKHTSVEEAEGYRQRDLDYAKENVKILKKRQLVEKVEELKLVDNCNELDAHLMSSVDEDANCKGKNKVGKEETESKVKNCLVKKTEAVRLKPFLYSPEGLLRLIRLDLGVSVEHETSGTFDSVEGRIFHNIQNEKLHDPPSKKCNANLTEEENGRVQRVIPDMGEESNPVDDGKEVDVRKYDEKKKVMGMSDVHIVTDYVYQWT